MKDIIANLYPPTLSLSVAFFAFLVSYKLTSSINLSLVLSGLLGILTYFTSRKISENLLMK